MRAPGFWQRDGAWPRLLGPLGTIYAEATARRLRRTGARAPVPVICCGNATAGGTGKTILALALAELLQARGARPAFVTRGYGGRLKGPLRVDPARHTAAAVGDEPLLLAARAPTFVAARRATALPLIGDASHLILDDGLQNPDLIKDLSFLLIDGGAGFGNGRVIPAGPLREPVASAAARAAAVVLIGADISGALARLPPALPVLRADLQPCGTNLSGRRVLGFAGIGRPEKFRRSLIESGAELADFVSFPDHHPYSAGDLAALRQRADRLGAALVTTAKDHVRIADGAGILILGVTLGWHPAGALADYMDAWLARTRLI